MADIFISYAREDEERFQLYDVPRPDQFAIELARGSGTVSRDQAPATSRRPGRKTSIISAGGWVHEDGTEIFKQGLYTGHPGVHTLLRGGTYTLTVGSDVDPAIGTYDVQIDAQN